MTKVYCDLCGQPARGPNAMFHSVFGDKHFSICVTVTNDPNEKPCPHHLDICQDCAWKTLIMTVTPSTQQEAK